MKARLLPEHLGIISPLLAVAIGLVLTARRELDVVTSPVVVGSVAIALMGLCAVFYGIIGAAVATVLLTGIAFFIHPAHQPDMALAFMLPPVAGWLGIGAIFARRGMALLRRRHLLDVSDEIRQLRARLAQLESLESAGNVAEILGAASAAWRGELERVIASSSQLLAQLPEQLRSAPEARELEASLRGMGEGLSAQDMLTGGMALEVQQEVKPGDIVSAALAATHDMYERMGLTVEMDIEQGGVPCAMDTKLMTQALVHLLRNAAEASATGSKVTVRAISDFRGERAVIEVIDRGSGIHQDVLPHIFKPFFTTRPGHMGLGLSIVREIVARHGGSVAVSANETRGVTFRARLPMRRAELSGQTAERARMRREEAPKPDIPTPEEKVIKNIQRIQQQSINDEANDEAGGLPRD